jgi:sulfur-carrier protein
VAPVIKIFIVHPQIVDNPKTQRPAPLRHALETLRTRAHPVKPRPAASAVFIRGRPVAAGLIARYNSLVQSAGSSVPVKVLFFGRLREIVGVSEASVDLADGSPIEALFASFASRYPELAPFRGSVVASRNREFAPWSAPLRSGDEVAFLPPVSGG